MGLMLPSDEVLNMISAGAEDLRDEAEKLRFRETQTSARAQD